MARLWHQVASCRGSPTLQPVSRSPDEDFHPCGVLPGCYWHPLDTAVPHRDSRGQNKTLLVALAERSCFLKWLQLSQRHPLLDAVQTARLPRASKNPAKGLPPTRKQKALSHCEMEFSEWEKPGHRHTHYYI